MQISWWNLYIIIIILLCFFVQNIQSHSRENACDSASYEMCCLAVFACPHIQCSYDNNILLQKWKHLLTLSRLLYAASRFKTLYWSIVSVCAYVTPTPNPNLLELWNIPGRRWDGKLSTALQCGNEHWQRWGATNTEEQWQQQKEWVRGCVTIRSTIKTFTKKGFRARVSEEQRHNQEARLQALVLSWAHHDQPQLRMKV